MELLTKSRTAVLNVVLDNPRISYRGIVEKIGSHYSTISWHLDMLKRAGLVTWEYRKEGTLRVYGCIKEDGEVVGYIGKKDGEVYWVSV
jgi:predicted transcriptional regulator